jgi:hypothetical protein
LKAWKKKLRDWNKILISSSRFHLDGKLALLNLGESIWKKEKRFRD